MIISRTPLRISFVGSDFGNGAVVSSTINKYMYISVNRKFDGKLKVAYTKTEIVDTADDLEHDLARCSLTLLNLKDGLEVSSICDIPAGTGLGSSGAYTVGLLRALHWYKGEDVNQHELAEEACEVEINMCGKKIGKQDQYASACGGLLYLEFGKKVDIYSAHCSNETKKKLENNLLMFYTGFTRPEEIINELNKKTLEEMSGLARKLREDLLKDDLSNFGDLLSRGWELKKTRSDKISTPEIDDWCKTAMENGAEGGKLLGAGGGGFLLFYAPKEKHQKIIDSLPLKVEPFSFEEWGSDIIYAD